MAKTDIRNLDLPAPVVLQADELAAVAGGFAGSLKQAVEAARLARIGVPIADMFQHSISPVANSFNAGSIAVPGFTAGGG